MRVLGFGVVGLRAGTNIRGTEECKRLLTATWLFRFRVCGLGFRGLEFRGLGVEGLRGFGGLESKGHRNIIGIARLIAQWLMKGYYKHTY